MRLPCTRCGHPANVTHRQNITAEYFRAYAYCPRCKVRGVWSVSFENEITSDELARQLVAADVFKHMNDAQRKKFIADIEQQQQQRPLNFDSA